MIYNFPRSGWVTNFWWDEEEGLWLMKMSHAKKQREIKTKGTTFKILKYFLKKQVHSFYCVICDSVWDNDSCDTLTNFHLQNCNIVLLRTKCVYFPDDFWLIFDKNGASAENGSLTFRYVQPDLHFYYSFICCELHAGYLGQSTCQNR